MVGRKSQTFEEGKRNGIRNVGVGNLSPANMHAVIALLFEIEEYRLKLEVHLFTASEHFEVKFYVVNGRCFCVLGLTGDDLAIDGVGDLRIQESPVGYLAGIQMRDDIADLQAGSLGWRVALDSRNGHLCVANSEGPFTILLDRSDRDVDHRLRVELCIIDLERLSAKDLQLKGLIFRSPRVGLNLVKPVNDFVVDLDDLVEVLKPSCGRSTLRVHNGDGGSVGSRMNSD